MIEVTTPKYNNVSVEHPSIVKAIKNMAKNGEPKEKIVKVVGMPMEVVERYSRTK